MLTLATSADPPEQAMTELSGILHRQVKFIHADANQINAMLDRYYPNAA